MSVRKMRCSGVAFVSLVLIVFSIKLGVRLKNQGYRRRPSIELFTVSDLFTNRIANWRVISRIRVRTVGILDRVGRLDQHAEYLSSAPPRFVR